MSHPFPEFIGDFKLPPEWYRLLQHLMGMEDWKITWCVCNEPLAEGVSGRCCYGEPGYATIQISPGLGIREEAYVAVHELLHGFTKQFQPQCGDEQEEALVDTLAEVVLLGVFARRKEDYE